VLRFTSVPKARCKHGHNLEVNLGSQSDTIDMGTPCSLITSFTYNFANLSTGSVILMGKNRADLVSQSTTTHITSLPFFPFGNPVTKSMAIFSHFHSGIGSGCNSPAGL